MILVFGFDNYYPCGGINDLVFQGKTIEEFEGALETDNKLSKLVHFLDIVEIYDTETKDAYSVEFVEETKIKTIKLKKEE